MRWRKIHTLPDDLKSSGRRVMLYRRGWREDMALCWWNGDFDHWNTVLGNAFIGATHWSYAPTPPAAEVVE